MSKLLLVEDEVDTQSLVRKRLEHEGYEVDIAETGKRGIEMYESALEAQPYDLILLDLMMPEMTGQEFLREVREGEEARGRQREYGVPIIVLSAINDRVEEAFQVGCDDFLTKPFEGKALLEKIKVKLKT